MDIFILIIFFVIPIVLKIVKKIPMSIIFILESIVILFIPSNIHDPGFEGIDRGVQFFVLIAIGIICGIIEFIVYSIRQFIDNNKTFTIVKTKWK